MKSITEVKTAKEFAEFIEAIMLEEAGAVDPAFAELILDDVYIASIWSRVKPAVGFLLGRITKEEYDELITADE